LYVGKLSAKTSLI